MTDMPNPTPTPAADLTQAVKDLTATVTAAVDIIRTHENTLTRQTERLRLLEDRVATLAGLHA